MTTSETRGVTVRDGYALFWGQWPSNWEYSPFTIGGVRFNCVEQWMMAKKAILFEDEGALRKIMGAQDPSDQKRYGREVRGYNDQKWARVRYQTVLEGVLEKYRQNEELCKLLLATGNLTFVEASPEDKVWGIGMRARDPDATKPGKWRGQNLLGKATTEARTIIRKERGLNPDGT